MARGRLSRSFPVRVVRRAGVSFTVGVLLLSTLVGLALLSFFYSDAAYTQNLIDRLSPPGENGYLLGTDPLGRDEFARVITGLRISLTIGAIAVVVGATTGVAVGIVAGYFRGITDDVLMRVTDGVLAIPLVLFALSVLAVVGTSIPALIAVIAFSQWMLYARTVRGETLSIRERPFVTAARSLGAGNSRIIRRNIFPHVVPSVVILATLNVSTAILIEAGLSFLGLGVQPPDPSLGSMLADAQPYLVRAPWLAFWPGLALTLLVLSINLVGDGLRSFTSDLEETRQ